MAVLDKNQQPTDQFCKRRQTFCFLYTNHAGNLILMKVKMTRNRGMAQCWHTPPTCMGCIQLLYNPYCPNFQRMFSVEHRHDKVVLSWCPEVSQHKLRQCEHNPNIDRVSVD